MWCPPTVIFQTQKGTKSSTTKATLWKREDWKRDVKIALMDIIILESICALTLWLQLDIWLPELVQQWLRLYIMAFSTAILKLVLECPCTFFLSRWHAADMTDMMIPIYNRPYLTSSPRDLWNCRWSVAAGHHLRNGFYNPACRQLLLLSHHPRLSRSFSLAITRGHGGALFGQLRLAHYLVEPFCQGQH